MKCARCFVIFFLMFFCVPKVFGYAEDRPLPEAPSPTKVLVGTLKDFIVDPVSEVATSYKQLGVHTVTTYKNGGANIFEGIKNFFTSFFNKKNPQNLGEDTTKQKLFSSLHKVYLLILLMPKILHKNTPISF